MFREFGSDKDSGHSYEDFYQQNVAIFKDKGIRLLEIGVLSGDSMKAWSKILGNAVLTGVDKNVPAYKDGYEFIHIDVSNKELLSKSVDGKEFDIIIDDGSHILGDQLAAMEVLFPHLSRSGFYIIEDVFPFETWKEFTRFGDVEVIDLRKVKDRFDDVLVIIRERKQ